MVQVGRSTAPSQRAARDTGPRMLQLGIFSTHRLGRTSAHALGRILLYRAVFRASGTTNGTMREFSGVEVPGHARENRVMVPDMESVSRSGAPRFAHLGRPGANWGSSSGRGRGLWGRGLRGGYRYRGICQVRESGVGRARGPYVKIFRKLHTFTTYTYITGWCVVATPTHHI